MQIKDGDVAPLPTKAEWFAHLMKHEEASAEFTGLWYWEILEGCEWARLLSVRPQYGDKCDWSELKGPDWVFLLNRQPQFVKYCNWDELDGRDWRALLELQPQFANRFKEQVVSGVRYWYDDYDDCTSIMWGEIDDPEFSGALVIPNVLDGHPVQYIAKRAFAGCSKLTSVVIPQGIEGIDDSAFAECMNLKSVVLSSSVKSIGAEAFCGCVRLSSLTIPKGELYHIWRDAFKNTALIENEATGVAICDGWVVGSNARCPAVVDLPEGVRGFAYFAFDGRVELESVTIPKGVTEIPAWTFQGCENLRTVVIPEGVTTIGLMAFHGCRKLSSVTIPSSVVGIGFRAFGSCDRTTPLGMCGVYGSAFSDCSELETIMFEGLPPMPVESMGMWMDLPGFTVGYYRSEHEAEWKKVINSRSGRWNGLRMAKVLPSGEVAGESSRSLVIRIVFDDKVRNEKRALLSLLRA